MRIYSNIFNYLFGWRCDPVRSDIFRTSCGDIYVRSYSCDGGGLIQGNGGRILRFINSHRDIGNRFIGYLDIFDFLLSLYLCSL